MARYAFSDLHGNYELWRGICARVQPNDKLYCLGDIIDRGEDGYKIYLEMMQHDNIRYIRGNHEMMATAAIPWLLRYEVHGSPVTNWMWNGGGKTWDQMEIMWEDLDEASFKEKANELIFFFDTMVDQYTIINKAGQRIILSHAGFTPGKEDISEIGWDRDHFWDEWPQELENTYIIHGHTPVQYLTPALERGYLDSRIAARTGGKPMVIKYANGHKIDIDMGTILSNRVALIDIDTLEVTYIDAPCN